MGYPHPHHALGSEHHLGDNTTNVRDQVGASEEPYHPRAPHHQHSNSRITLPDDALLHPNEDEMHETYSNYLEDVDNLLDRDAPRASFLHRRNRSFDRGGHVDMSHITNYLRSQDQILN